MEKKKMIKKKTETIVRSHKKDESFYIVRWSDNEEMSIFESLDKLKKYLGEEDYETIKEVLEVEKTKSFKVKVTYDLELEDIFV